MDPDQLILVDKPIGITSFDVIRRLRKRLGNIKMGHAGTLDPLASGLMIIALGKETKKLSELLGLPKTYSAEIQFGIKTETGDSEGKIIEEKIVPTLSIDRIEKALQSLQGEHEFSVPLYSAIKRNGKPLYEYAREGISIELPKKKMLVIDSKCTNYVGSVATVWFNVGSGTYIRTLAEELAINLGTVAHLKSLRRLSIGDFNLTDKKIISDL